jgi:hypothetical protein
MNYYFVYVVYYIALYFDPCVTNFIGGILFSIAVVRAILPDNQV